MHPCQPEKQMHLGTEQTDRQAGSHAIYSFVIMCKRLCTSIEAIGGYSRVPTKRMHTPAHNKKIASHYLITCTHSFEMREKTNYDEAHE